MQSQYWRWLSQYLEKRPNWCYIVYWKYIIEITHAFKMFILFCFRWVRSFVMLLVTVGGTSYQDKSYALTSDWYVYLHGKYHHRCDQTALITSAVDVAAVVLLCYVMFATLNVLIYFEEPCKYVEHIDGILPKGPYPPCLRMADRALLAGYPRYLEGLYQVNDEMPSHTKASK